ncbi:hypothetical protein [Thioalkalivibrio nitratireducens]|uniref:hypothetical protein n=1 Tax=Thioalkalivibrio nitratireducens TaxID=186931 RepID=UPI0009F9FA74|nr:hypothetical protein [Thioalkalivibrio nitratireducens]
MTVSVKVTACLVSRATRRAEERSVIRRSAFAPPRRPRQPRRRMADDGLRPFPPYASFITGGGHIGHGS